MINKSYARLLKWFTLILIKFYHIDFYLVYNICKLNKNRYGKNCFCENYTKFYLK